MQKEKCTQMYSSYSQVYILIFMGRMTLFIYKLHLWTKKKHKSTEQIKCVN